MIDTAWARSTTAIRTAAASLFGDARPAAILLTHIHPDHSGSASALGDARLRSSSCPSRTEPQ